MITFKLLSKKISVFSLLYAVLFLTCFDAQAIKKPVNTPTENPDKNSDYKFRDIPDIEDEDEIEEYPYKKPEDLPKLNLALINKVDLKLKEELRDAFLIQNTEEAIQIIKKIEKKSKEVDTKNNPQLCSATFNSILFDALELYVSPEIFLYLLQEKDNLGIDIHATKKNLNLNIKQPCQILNANLLHAFVINKNYYFYCTKKAPTPENLDYFNYIENLLKSSQIRINAKCSVIFYDQIKKTKYNANYLELDEILNILIN
ncbi:MAG: hypothetical protein ABH827_04995 [bacterium]